jgi:hypothetical protein
LQKVVTIKLHGLQKALGHDDHACYRLSGHSV